jgi:hypothetical protein
MLQPRWATVRNCVGDDGLIRVLSAQAMPTRFVPPDAHLVTSFSSHTGRV